MSTVFLLGLALATASGSPPPAWRRQFETLGSQFLSARTLKAMMERGEAFVLVDAQDEEKVYKLCVDTGIGAQFGGKYCAHDVRLVRLPRHGASCPVGLGVSCSAHRQILGKITRDGVWLAQLDANPAWFLPEVRDDQLSARAVQIDLHQPMPDIFAELRQHSVTARLSFSGPMIVARDIVHARFTERLDRGEELPQYLKDHVVFYAGPAKTPPGYASGAFGPTTSGPMDSAVGANSRRRVWISR